MRIAMLMAVQSSLAEKTDFLKNPESQQERRRYDSDDIGNGTLAVEGKTQADFRDLAEILQDPGVMYAYEHDFSDDDVQTWLDRQIGRYKAYGFGLWAIVLKTTGEMIGQAGLTM